MSFVYCQAWSVVAWPAAAWAWFTAWALGPWASDVSRISTLMLSPVTPFHVAPPLPPAYLATHGLAYSEYGTCRTPGPHGTPPVVVPVPACTAWTPGPAAALPAAAARPPPPAPLAPAGPPPVAAPAAATPVSAPPVSAAGPAAPPPPVVASPADDEWWFTVGRSTIMNAH